MKLLKNMHTNEYTLKLTEFELETFATCLNSFSSHPNSKDFDKDMLNFCSNISKTFYKTLDS